MSDSWKEPIGSSFRKCLHGCYVADRDNELSNPMCSVCASGIQKSVGDPAVTRRMCAEIAEAERETKEARAQMLRAEAEREEREAAEEEAENAMELNLTPDRTEEAEADAEA